LIEAARVGRAPRPTPRESARIQAIPAGEAGALDQPKAGDGTEAEEHEGERAEEIARRASR